MVRCWKEHFKFMLQSVMLYTIKSLRYIHEYSWAEFIQLKWGWYFDCYSMDIMYSFVLYLVRKPNCVFGRIFSISSIGVNRWSIHFSSSFENLDNRRYELTRCFGLYGLEIIIIIEYFQMEGMWDSITIDLEICLNNIIDFWVSCHGQVIFLGVIFFYNWGNFSRWNWLGWKNYW